MMSTSGLGDSGIRAPSGRTTRDRQCPGPHSGWRSACSGNPASGVRFLGFRRASLASPAPGSAMPRSPALTAPLRAPTIGGSFRFGSPAAVPAVHRVAVPHVQPRPPRRRTGSGVRRASIPRCARAVRDRRDRRLRAAPPTARYVGFTANSFTSVSLDPPLVLWSLARRSASLAAFEAAPGYAINVLSAQQADLARRFSRPHADRFAGVAHRLGAVGCPADRRLRRVARMPALRAASGRRSRRVHRPGRDRRALAWPGAGIPPSPFRDDGAAPEA